LRRFFPPRSPAHPKPSFIRDQAKTVSRLRSHNAKYFSVDEDSHALHALSPRSTSGAANN
jgi:hypothetical protein